MEMNASVEDFMGKEDLALCVIQHRAIKITESQENLNRAEDNELI